MITEDNNLYDKEIWDDGYKDYNFFIAGDADPVKKFILDNIGDKTGSCFEIGCFPGRYLAVLGARKWLLNGLDQTLYLSDMIKWLKANQYQIGEFKNQKIEDTLSKTKYDLVYSCGFIEHFIDWEQIFIKHLSLVKDGGRIIITTPNFNGMQGLLHRNLDKVNFERHNVKSMNIWLWEKILVDHGFKVLKKGYFGRFNFWYGAESRSYRKRFILFRFMSMVPLIKRMVFFNSRTLSPFCGIAAIKLVKN